MIINKSRPQSVADETHFVIASTACVNAAAVAKRRSGRLAWPG